MNNLKAHSLSKLECLITLNQPKLQKWYFNFIGVKIEKEKERERGNVSYRFWKEIQSIFHFPKTDTKSKKTFFVVIVVVVVVVVDIFDHFSCFLLFIL